MFMIGVPLDYYVDSYKDRYESEIKLYCKSERISMDYFKNLIHLIIQK